MKVGMDSVLLSCWIADDNYSRILDVGTGCGVIALLLADRFPEALVTCLDIDQSAVSLTRVNIEKAGFEDRVDTIIGDFNTWDRQASFDLIVSNPPYFQNSIPSQDHARQQWRHVINLSWQSIIESGASCLSQVGKICFIAPYESRDVVAEEARRVNLKLSRFCIVYAKPNLNPNRMMVELLRGDNEKVLSSDAEEMHFRAEDGTYHPDFVKMCQHVYADPLIKKKASI